MDRRKFIKSSVFTAAGIVAGKELLAQDVVAGIVIPGAVSSDGKRGDVSNGVESHLDVSGYVREPAHKIPVVAEADVVVVGGGPAGAAAAVCAAREGASTILVERNNFLGGLWTGGLVLPVLATSARGKSVPWEKATGGFCSEICDTLLASGDAIRPSNPIAEPEATKYLLDKMMMDAGVKVIYCATGAGVTMSGNRIESVLLDCSTGRIAVKCKMVVDASGDGCIFNFSGDPHEDRRYHISSSYRLFGLDDSRLGSQTPIPTMKLKGFGTREAMDGLDILKVSQLQQEHRIKIWQKVQQLRENPEFADVHLMEVNPITGIRVTRVLDSLHNVTLEESMEYTEYDDCIGMSGVCEAFDYKGRHISQKDRPIWQIPYRSLVPQETLNLLVAGRCFGYDQAITWDAREISTCFVTGQAAGTAAALCAATRCSNRDLDTSILRTHLRAAKVKLDF